MSWYELLPKVELHIHLEGVIPHRAMWQLIEKYGGVPSVPDQRALGERFIAGHPAWPKETDSRP
jgi:adenosine deaminase